MIMGGNFMKRFALPSFVILVVSFAVFSCGGGGGGGGGSSLFTEPAYFVSVTDPAASDANPGTQEEPFATIQTAIDAAAAAYSTANIYVAAGTYLVDSGALVPDVITLKEGVSLWGGWAADWSSRDPATQITIIQDDAIADAADGVNETVTADAGVTAATVMDGFDIQGASGITAAGVYLVGASPTFSNNSITAGAGSDHSYGIYLEDSSSVLSTNTISASGSSDEAVGVAVTGTSAVAVLGNIITGGVATGSSMGIYNDSDDTTMRGNTVTGSLGSGWAYAIYNQGVDNTVVQDNVLDGGEGTTISVGLYNYVTASYTVSGNTIDGGSANNSYGIVNYQTGTLTIERNVIFGGTNVMTTGIADRHGSANLIRNNLIHGGGPAIASNGVYCEDAYSQLENNTIYGGSGSTSSFGVYLSHTGFTATTQPWLYNNIVFTGTINSTCVSEQAASADPVFLQNNVLTGCETIYYDMDGGCTGNADSDGDDNTCTFAEMEALGDIAAPNNVAVDPALEDEDGPDNNINTMGDNLWSLSASSPATVTDGGMDRSAFYTGDYTGATRTVPWSIGAYEYD